MSSPRSRATTKTTSWSRCCRSRSSPFHACSPGSTTRRTSGCSTTCGVSTCRSRRRTCSPVWSRKPSRSVRSFDLLSLEGGKARLAEVTLAEGSPAIAKELTDLGLPRESTVVAVLRDGHVVVPRGDTVLHEGDEVLVLVTGGVEDDVRRGTGGLTMSLLRASNATISRHEAPAPAASAHRSARRSLANASASWARSSA